MNEDRMLILINIIWKNYILGINLLYRTWKRKYPNREYHMKNYVNISIEKKVYTNPQYQQQTGTFRFYATDNHKIIKHLNPHKDKWRFIKLYYL